MGEVPDGARRRRHGGALNPRPAVRPRADAGSVAGVRLPRAPRPTAEYVPAVEARGLLFVSGQDPETDGRLVYRGRVGRDLTAAEARRAAWLATLNALAAARDTLGSLGAARRCVALTCFVDAVPEAVEPGIVRDAVALVREAFGDHRRPIVCLRPVCGLAAGIPVEVELLLEVAPRAGARLGGAQRRRWRRKKP